MSRDVGSHAHADLTHILELSTDEYARVCVYALVKCFSVDLAWADVNASVFRMCVRKYFVVDLFAVQTQYYAVCSTVNIPFATP